MYTEFLENIYATLHGNSINLDLQHNQSEIKNVCYLRFDQSLLVLRFAPVHSGAVIVQPSLPSLHEIRGLSFLFHNGHSTPRAPGLFFFLLEEEKTPAAICWSNGISQLFFSG